MREIALRTLVLLIIFSMPRIGSCDPQTKQQFLDQLNSSNYIERAKNNADSMAIGLNISQWSPTSDGVSVTDPDNSDYWLGTTTGEMLFQLYEDLRMLLVDDWDGCFDFDAYDYRWELHCSGWSCHLRFRADIEYWWPYQFVETHRTYHSRYIPRDSFGAAMYPMWYNTVDPAANVLYPAMETGQTAETALGHAQYQSRSRMNRKILGNPFYALAYHDLFDPVAHVLPWQLRRNWINPLNPDDSPDYDLLDDARKRHRYASGKIGNLNVLDFTLLPSPLHAAWTVLATYFPLLNMIPCRPDSRFPTPVMSDMPGMMEFTRDPLYAYLLFQGQDSTMRNAWRDWLRESDNCVRRNASTSFPGIPNNMYTPPSPTVMPKLLDNHATNASYDKICTDNWGATFPATVNHALSQYDAITAGINVEKGALLSNALWELVVDNTAAEGYMGRFPIATKRGDRADKIQYALNGEVSHSCRKLGNPRAPFTGPARAPHKAAESEWSVYHWRRISCKVNGFQAIAMEILNAAWEGFGPIIDEVLGVMDPLMQQLTSQMGSEFGGMAGGFGP